MDINFENVKSCFLGLAIGDALGVPVEFRNRSFLKEHPIKTMIGYGAWNQPPGTWSDDSSLTFCLAESLVSGYDLSDIAKKFLLWYKNGYWGAHHKLFDIGGTTRLSLARIEAGEDPEFAGELGEESNGNGSLMRIAPAAIYFCDLSDADLFNRIKEVSAITHGHFRSVFSCFVFSKYVIELLKGEEKVKALQNTGKSVLNFAKANEFNESELKLFNRILSGEIQIADEHTVESTGYVLHTLEASIWCLLTTDSFPDAVLKAVNLGGDTDTTACVTGALAGLYYGEKALLPEWRKTLVREKDIIKLAEDFTESVKNKILRVKT